MSDFLQFVDRVPTLPNRKKITHEGGSIEYATVEYADEPIEEGTALNKDNFNILNNVIGYNKINGIFNPTTSTIEYELDTFDESKVVDNMRLLLQSTNEVQAPATNIRTIKSTTSIGEYFTDPISLELSDGNVCVAGTRNTGALYVKIFSPSGELLYTASSQTYFQYTKIIELNNGNILIAGNRPSYNTCYITIFDKQLNIIVSSKSVGDLGDQVYIEQFDNNNILIVANYSSNTVAYYSIVNESGTTVKSQTSLGDNNRRVKGLYKLDNGNIMVLTSGILSYISIISPTGTIVKSPTELGNNSYYSSMIKLSNGNFVVWGADYQNNYKYIKIIDQSGNDVVSEKTFDGKNIYSIIQLQNGNLFVVMTINSTYYTMELDNNLNIIRNEKQLDLSINSYRLMELSSTNILIKHRTTGSSAYNALSIITSDGDVVLNQMSISSYLTAGVIQLANNYLFAIGVNSTTGQIAVFEPYADGGSVKLNGIDVDTLFAKDKYYELIYNATQNKFICEEVRNAN